jgi:hypothetical protein
LFLFCSTSWRCNNGVIETSGGFCYCLVKQESNWTIVGVAKFSMTGSDQSEISAKYFF